MILDKELQFSDAQALTGSAASTSVVNLGAASKLFTGEPMAVLVTVDVAADVASGDETYAFALQTDDAVGFGSPTELVSRSIDKALLTAGSKHTLVVPFEASVEQYLRLNYTLGGTTPSVTVTAHLVPSTFIDKFTTYPDAVTIS